jgi:hypothetical protein
LKRIVERVAMAVRFCYDGFEFHKKGEFPLLGIIE